jgi:hypothetical protein
MERMVSDKTIKKVALVCDSVYAEKADSRTGGVGTETQIITPDIYSQQDQTKFVAVIAERDEHGKPYVPTYYKSRIYIDLSDPTTYAENFDRLIRWAYDQPLHTRPDLGPKPAFLTADADALHLGTSARHRRAIDALKAGRDYALPAVTEYLDLMAAELEKLRLKSPATREEVETFDETVLTSIGAFLPYRNELIEFFATAALYQDTEPMRAPIHKFFERLIPYLDRPANLNSWREYDFDNYKFMIQELFLYLIATFIKADRLEGAAYFLDQEYYVAGNSVYGSNKMVPFTLFRHHLSSLQYRSQRLRPAAASHANTLKDRCTGVGIEFRQLQEADFVMYLGGVIRFGGDRIWWPETLVFIHGLSGPFEMFARCKSAKYFDRVKQLIGVKDKNHLEQVVLAAEAKQLSVPRYDYSELNLRVITGFDQIGTRP